MVLISSKICVFKALKLLQNLKLTLLTVLTGAGGGGPLLLLSKANCFFNWFCILLKLVLPLGVEASGVFGLIVELGISGDLCLLLLFGCT